MQIWLTYKIRKFKHHRIFSALANFNKKEQRKIFFKGILSTTLFENFSTILRNTDFCLQRKRFFKCIWNTTLFEILVEILESWILSTRILPLFFELKCDIYTYTIYIHVYHLYNFTLFMIISFQSVSFSYVNRNMLILFSLVSDKNEKYKRKLFFFQSINCSFLIKISDNKK